ncbi:hypothetical protein [Janthinobacterium lividum]|uniref:hypothetical protein n=1 Tax=Janthinobacterium lividum TaxID=29581 RepID=UPI00140780E6|nr:hypothetical protein [Janthinobacterium lividum]NHQ92029.1 hypothetical protein [Janthinobacterium lividum]
MRALPAPGRSRGDAIFMVVSAGAARQLHLPGNQSVSADFRFLGITLKRKISIVNKKKVITAVYREIWKITAFYLSFYLAMPHITFAIVARRIHATA